MSLFKKKLPEPTRLENYEAAAQAYEIAKLTHAQPDTEGIVLKKGEIAHLVVSGVGYIEPKRLPTTWQGGNRGVSLHIAKGLTYRVGATRGRVQPGAEVLQATDEGTFVATNQRFIFVGSKRTTEWALSKLIGFALDGIPGTAVFNVTNRQKPSGVAYGTSHERQIEAALAGIIAREQGPEAHQRVLDELAAEVRAAAVAAGVPIPPEVQPKGALPPTPAPTAASVPPSWRPDPRSRFDYRWWDGEKWTARVSRGGAILVDPDGA